MAYEDLMKQIAETFEKEGNVRAVFAEPVKLETKTVIPVAAISLGGGAGGMGPVTESKVARAILGGGGGAAIQVQPVGFIHERDGEVVFTPIHVDVKGKPFLTEASAGIGRAIDVVSTTISDFAHLRFAPPKHHKPS